MRRTLLAAVTTIAAAVGLTAGAATTTGSAQAAPGAHGQRVCTDAMAGEASCHAIRLVDSTGQSVDPRAVDPQAVDRQTGAARPAAVSGKSPSDIQSAYRLGGLSAPGRTVAVVDAYGYPNAERDLAVYRSQQGLTPCTTASGCLRIVNQGGGASLPRFNLGWAQEQALDLDAVSAACPTCSILLVQASSASFTNLGTAVNTAATQPGVVAISNSYGGGDAADSSYGRYYNHPGIAVTASTGDNGYQGASYPASSVYVTAVGGTSLTKSSGVRGWTESVWSGSGSGCSTYNAQPLGQASVSTGCPRRAMADVAAVADPQTGLAVYAPTSSRSSSWAQYGGTSLSSPIVAAVYALSGDTTSGSGGYANNIPYAHAGSLFDVTSGSNGSCASWCSARPGWDGPTGLGTPNGTAAF